MSLLLDDPRIDSFGPAADDFTPEMLADLLHSLGDIPADRVHLKPAPGTATERDLLAFLENRNRLAELVDGTIVEKPVGLPEARLANCLTYFAERFLDDFDLGITSGADSTLRIVPDNIRLPDFSFFRWDGIPDRKILKIQCPILIPDLAVEILSPSNTKREMARKRGEYFSAGTRLVWEVEPDTKTVRVYTDADTFTTVDESGTLSGGDVMPGFTLSVRKWFERAFRDGA